MAFSPTLDGIFARRGWLSRQSPEARRRVLEISRRVEYDAGEEIVRIGDDAGGLYGIVSGGVGSIAMSDLVPPTLGHIMRPGTWFGERPLLTGGERTMTFRAMENTELLLAPLSALRPLMTTDVGFATMVAELAHDAVQDSINVAVEGLIKDSRRRLAATLLRITAVREGVVSASPQGFRINQVDLAEMVALSRNHSNRILNDLQAAGLVTLSYNHIRIDDPDGLVAYVRQGGQC